MLDEDDVMLPEGWQEGDVLFEETVPEIQEVSQRETENSGEEALTERAPGTASPAPERVDAADDLRTEEPPAAPKQNNGAAAQVRKAIPTAGRDYRGEVMALLEARPELRGKSLPDSVHQACLRGKSLLAAYADYEVGRERSAAERLRRENDILRQNAAAAARAPVTAAGGGAAGAGMEDDFLRGFNSED